MSKAEIRAHCDECGFLMRIHPSNYPLLFGVSYADCIGNLEGIHAQCKAEALGLV